MFRNPYVIGFIILALLLTLNSTVYIVEQTEMALVTELGKPVKIVKKPGLKAKVPFLQSVSYFDNRLLGFTVKDKEPNLNDSKRLVVDAYVRYRITDPLRFFQTVGTDQALQNRLMPIIDSSMRTVISQHPMEHLISPERANIMKVITQIAHARASGVPVKVEPSVAPPVTGNAPAQSAEVAPPGGFGIDIVDVRIVRADLPKENSQAVFRRMQTQLESIAKLRRAEGEQKGQEKRADADRERAVIIAEAQRDGEIIRGEGDGEAIKVFAESFGRDPEFFGFYRSMQAYRNALQDKDTTMILSPNGEFLKYLDKSR